MTGKVFSNMVVDSSALISVLFGETNASKYLEALVRAPRLLMSAFSWFETAAVVEARKGAPGVRRFHELINELGVEIIPFDSGQAEVAFDAWRRFRKGMHPAGLNLGDCTAYALARTLNDKLLFQGADFPETDIPSGLS